MAGRLSDLEEPSVRVPDTLIVDTNLVVARVLSIDRLPRLPETPRTTRFFAMLRGPGAIGYLPPVVA